MSSACSKSSCRDRSSSARCCRSLPYGGIIAGHVFRLPLSKLGMFPMPKSLPMPHAEQLFDENGTLVSDTEWARIIDRVIPWALIELSRYAAALAPLRHQAKNLREVLEV